MTPIRPVTLTALATLLVGGLALGSPAAHADGLTCQGRAVTVTGDSGTPGDDVMVVGPGQRSVETGAGNDLVCIRLGDDVRRYLFLDTGAGRRRRAQRDDGERPRPDGLPRRRFRHLRRERRRRPSTSPPGAPTSRTGATPRRTSSTRGAATTRSRAAPRWRRPPTPTSSPPAPGTTASPGRASRRALRSTSATDAQPTEAAIGLVRRRRRGRRRHRDSVTVDGPTGAALERRGDVVGAGVTPTCAPPSPAPTSAST